LFQCDYLIGDEQQQQTIREANSQEGLDPDSNLFKAVMENPYIQRAVNNPKLFFSKNLVLFKILK